MVFKQALTGVQFQSFVDAMSQYESDLGRLEKLGLVAELDLPANHKLAMFCRLYEIHIKQKYNVSPADSGKIKLIKLDEPFLVFYFTVDEFLFKKKHSIGNLVKYYNEARALYAAAAAPAKSKYPDYFSQAFQDKLTPKECPAYWAHLRSLGLVPKKDRFMNVNDWIKPENNN